MNKDASAVDGVRAGENMSVGHSQNREIVEPSPGTHGFVTITHGIWHDDPNGAMLVNNRRGFYTFENVMVDEENLLTEPGRDFFHAQVYTNTAAGTRGGGFIAVSAEVTAPVATDTDLAGEITAGGLARADASIKNHVVGTNVTTLQHTFTATAPHTAVHKAALFNQAGPPVAGIMTHAAVFTSDVTLAINDTLTVTWTNTLG